MPFSPLRLIVICAVTLPFPAASACLTASDLDQGVVFTFDNDDTTVVRALGAGMVEVTENYAASGTAIRFQNYIGPYSLREDDLGMSGVPIPDSWSVTQFAVDLADLPIPAADTPPWTGMTTYQEFGASPVSQSAAFQFRAGDAVTLSGCTYDVVLVAGSFERTEPDPWAYQQFSYYFPALGTSVIVAWSNQDDGYAQAMPVAVARLP